MHIFGEIDAKELAYIVVVLGKSKTCTVGWHSGNLGKAWCSVLSLNSAGWQAGSRQIFCAAAWREIHFSENLYLPFRPSTDGLGPTPTRKNNLLYSESTLHMKC